MTDDRVRYRDDAESTSATGSVAFETGTSERTPLPNDDWYVRLRNLEAESRAKERILGEIRGKLDGFATKTDVSDLRGQFYWTLGIIVGLGILYLLLRPLIPSGA